MRIFLFLSLFFVIFSCATVEVTKEVIKATSSVKTSVKEILPNNKDKKVQIEETKEEIVKEKKIIEEEQKAEKTIIAKQQKLSELNFIGNTEIKIKKLIGEPQLTRSDGSVYMLRYDSEGCRLFIFFNNSLKIKLVQYFEIRDHLGVLLNTKQSLEQCYRELSLIN